MKMIICVLFSIILTSCATLLSGTSQTINVKVVDAKDQKLLTGVTCSVSNNSGPMETIVANPTVIAVPTGDGAIRIDCKRRGYRQLNMAVGNSFNAVTVVNVLFWPGFIVDAISGAYKKYPSHYIVNMEKIK